MTGRPVISVEDTDGPLVALAKMTTAGMELIGRVLHEADLLSGGLCERCNPPSCRRCGLPR